MIVEGNDVHEARATTPGGRITEDSPGEPNRGKLGYPGFITKSAAGLITQGHQADECE